MSRRYSFGKSERLRKNFEFKKARDKGASYREDVFSLTIHGNSAGAHRLGLSVGKAKIPLAAGRNRVKRLIREAFRINKGRLKGGPYDIIVSIRQPLRHKADYRTVEKTMLTLFKKARAL